MKRQNTKLYLFCSLFSALLLLAATVLLAASWGALPERIAKGAAGDGETVRKAVLVVELLVGWALWGLLSLANRLPSLWQDSVGAAFPNGARICGVISEMLGFMKLCMSVLFAALIAFPALGRPLPAWLAPAALLLLLLSLFFFLVRLFRAQ